MLWTPQLASPTPWMIAAFLLGAAPLAALEGAIAPLASAASANETPAIETIDRFEDISIWAPHPADGVEMRLASEAGVTGGALRFDFRFTGGGYAVARRSLALDLPDNYAFRFRLRGQAQPNHLEFKLIDETGENVWWCVRRDLQFPLEWELVTIKKRQIGFAWGPKGGGEIHHVAALEVVVTAGRGGAGTIWIDDLELETLPPPGTPLPPPVVRASSVREWAPAVDRSVDRSGDLAERIVLAPLHVLDGDPSTAWEPASSDTAPWLEIDLGRAHEYGGLTVEWLEGRRPLAYVVESALQDGDWHTLREVKGGVRSKDYLYLPESDSRFIRIRIVDSTLAPGGTGPRSGESGTTGQSAPSGQSGPKRPEAESETVSLAEIGIQPLSWSATRAAFFQAVASEAPRGSYPRSFSGEQSYWTVVGLDRDRREALLGEDGALEVGRGECSIEPFLLESGRLWSWSDLAAEQSLEERALPLPSVRWPVDPSSERALELTITAVAHGTPDSSSVAVRYAIQNRSSRTAMGTLLLAVRPFQVNPPSQQLNLPGGTARVERLERTGAGVRINDERDIFCLEAPDRFRAASFDEGDVVADYLFRGRLPEAEKVHDPFGAASGVIEYELVLTPGARREIVLDVPLHSARTSPPSGTGDASSPEDASVPADASPPADASTPAGAGHASPAPAPSAGARDGHRNGLAVVSGTNSHGYSAWFAELLETARDEWSSRLTRVTIELPQPAAPLVESLRSQIGYILVNRAGPAIQPGTRSYARSWIRDGALTSSALLRVGLSEPVREFLEWFAPHQYENGKIPCVVDDRGADPVPEHDSSGEFIFLVAEYYRYTQDRALVARLWPAVWSAAGYLDALRQERRIDAYRAPETAHFFGILPPSISHEGYSAKPMHSYWDDLWALRGFKDAVELAALFGKDDEHRRLVAIRDEFASDLAASIDAAMSHHGIDYVPGSADLGDFDATSTTIVLDPVQALDLLPRAAIERTFERYWEFFRDRENGKPWEAFTPYEIRNAGAFVRLGWRDRAHEALQYFLRHQRPTGWRQWPEVVWSDPRAPRFLGDLPHTWVGSDYVRAVLDLFAYCRDEDQTLVIGVGIPPEWVRASDDERAAGERAADRSHAASNDATAGDGQATTDGGASDNGPKTGNVTKPVDGATTGDALVNLDERAGVRVGGLQTPHGPLTYEMRPTALGLEVRIGSGLRVPPGGIVVRSPLGPLRTATVNGVPVSADGAAEIVVREVPAEVVMRARLEE